MRQKRNIHHRIRPEKSIAIHRSMRVQENLLNPYTTCANNRLSCQSCPFARKREQVGELDRLQVTGKKNRIGGTLGNYLPSLSKAGEHAVSSFSAKEQHRTTLRRKSPQPRAIRTTMCTRAHLSTFFHRPNVFLSFYCSSHPRMKDPFSFAAGLAPIIRKK